MRALHLFSNWKWTGPAELAVNLCRGLGALGVDARFACGRTPEGEPGRSAVADRARELGVEPVLADRVGLSKHVRLVGNWQDARAIREHVAREGIEVLHAHL